MRPKHQVTLPAAIVRQANIKLDDRLTVDFINGAIVITPNRTKTESLDANVMPYAGIGRGLWGNTPEEVTKTIHNLRNEWER